MKIAVIGAGYVGLTTAVCLAERGHTVAIAEQNAERREAITAGQAPFYEPLLDDLLRQSIASHHLSVVPTVDEALRDAQVTFVAVGTPFDGITIDLSHISTACTAIGKALKNRKDYHVIAVKSTVVPGTTDTLVRQQIEENSGLTMSSYGLCMNPEFLREGSAVYDFREPDRIVIGSADKRSGEILAAVYSSFDCPVLHMSLRNAELTKYASNALLSLLVSFSNELAVLCESFPGTDIDEIMDGLHMDKRLSPVVAGKRVMPEILHYLRAGCGFGGSCLPKDVNALRSFAASLGLQMPLMDATIAINEARTEQVLKILEHAIGSFSNKEIAVLGLAFKPNTDDVRDSPALKIIAALRAKGCRVRTYDPLVKANLFGTDENVTQVSSVEVACAGAHAMIIATAWPEFKSVDWAVVARQMLQPPVFVDGRRLLTQAKLPDNVIYHPIGAHDSVSVARTAD